MKSFKDLSGMKFGRLTILERHYDNKPKSRTKWLCKCDCGKDIIILSQNISNGKSKSCGCLQREVLTKRNTTHGMSNTRIYQIYSDAKDRCHNPNNPYFKDYGDRGVVMCSEWVNSFDTFYKWAMDNGYSNSLTIDRIDVDRDYSPNNCRWVNQTVQQNNKRNNHLITYDGQTMTLSEWARFLGIKRVTLAGRIANGWDIDRAFN